MSEIFLFRGFEEEDILKGKNQLASQGVDLQDMVFIRADEKMLEENVEALLTRIDREGAESAGGAPGSMAVIMAVQSQEKALTVMRAFKKILPEAGKPAFAMITPTSLTWTLGYYMDHVTKEHEYMKDHNPADDPDMKKIN